MQYLALLGMCHWLKNVKVENFTVREKKLNPTLLPGTRIMVIDDGGSRRLGIELKRREKG